MALGNSLTRCYTAYAKQKAPDKRFPQCPETNPKNNFNLPEKKFKFYKNYFHENANIKMCMRKIIKCWNCVKINIEKLFLVKKILNFIKK